ncbi:CoA biosynthesis protein CoaBC [Actinomyces sp. 565]|nr:CoA biosynthesis protein CoaBC [Actinomyces sp. 565]
MVTTRFVLHVSQADRWPAALSNRANMTELGFAEAITVMVNGTAIYAIQGANDWTSAMERAAAAGGTFEVCSRSVANHSLPVESLPPWFRVVPAAIPAIAEHVRAGATYIKP